MNAQPKPDLFTLEQLAGLDYASDGIGRRRERPLLICDVDEVVLHLVDPFQQVMEERGFELRTHSFQLTGNVVERGTGREATQDEVWAGLTQLFEEQDRRQDLVPGVVDGLTRVGERADVVFLTNMPHTFGDRRRQWLARNGLDFPLVTNGGRKSPAVRILARHHTGASGFIDDTPHNLTDVREAVPNVALFHFMAHPKFRELAGAVEGVAPASGDWNETAETILERLCA